MRSGARGRPAGHRVALRCVRHLSQASGAKALCRGQGSIDFAAAVLKRHRTAQAEERLKLGPAWDNHDLVFANELGRPIEAGNLLRRSFWPLLERAELPKVRFHDLRHTAATLQLERGTPVKVVAELLGHASAAMTLDVYGHVTPTMQQQAADTFDQIVSG